jgi:hypothetical protein
MARGVFLALVVSYLVAALGAPCVCEPASACDPGVACCCVGRDASRVAGTTLPQGIDAPLVTSPVQATVPAEPPRRPSEGSRPQAGDHGLSAPTVLRL